MSKRMRPFFSYFGSKWMLAPKYPAPLYDTIIEPFAGSANYATLYADRNVILVDLDENIFRTWDYLIRSSAEDIMRLPVDIPGSVDDLPICEEARLLVGWWVNPGSAAPRKTPSKWMRTNNNKRAWLFWGNRVKTRLAAQNPRIKHWKITQGPYADIAHKGLATWFIDPPYQIAGKSYRKGSKGIDFSHLGGWCRNREGQAIVCENAGADWLPFEPFSNVKCTPSKNRPIKVSKEVIWHKRPPGIVPGEFKGTLWELLEEDEFPMAEVKEEKR